MAKVLKNLGLMFTVGGLGKENQDGFKKLSAKQELLTAFKLLKAAPCQCETDSKQAKLPILTSQASVSLKRTGNVSSPTHLVGRSV